MSFLLDLIMCEATREESLRALPVVQLVMQTHTGNVNAASHGTQYVPCRAAVRVLLLAHTPLLSLLMAACVRFFWLATNGNSRTPWFCPHYDSHYCDTLPAHVTRFMRYFAAVAETVEAVAPLVPAYLSMLQGKPGLSRTC